MKKEITQEEYYNIVGIDEDLNLGYEVDMINSFLQDYDLDEYYPQDIIHEVADHFTEIYNNELFKLYSNNLKLLSYHEQAQEEGLINDNTDLIQQLQIGQYEYNNHILFIVAEYFNLLD